MWRRAKKTSETARKMKKNERSHPNLSGCGLFFCGNPHFSLETLKKLCYTAKVTKHALPSEGRFPYAGMPFLAARKNKPIGGIIMSVISMKQLLEAGVHFGHQTRRWNPKMAPYIYTERNGIYIIDLQKSVGKVDEAYAAVKNIVAEGGKILFVGTKKQAQDSIKSEAERCGMYFVNERWLGGMLTNFKTIRSRIARLKEIEKMSQDGTFDILPKKEVIGIKKEWEKLEKNLGGIKDMTQIPDAIFVVDPKKERICVQEAHSLNIPLIGIADTNCDPDELDYVIPGNDDAIRAVKLIVGKMADAVIEANQGEELVDNTESEAEESKDEASEQ